MIGTIDIEITPDTSYVLTTCLHVDGSIGRLPPALLTCQFKNAQGAVLTEVPEGFVLS